ncbi:MAG: NADH-quinone oxidoreductase subunit J family protein [Acidimicrobiia bacterium]
MNVAATVAFYVIAVAMALAAIGVVRTQNVVHAALYLVVVLAGTAAIYILLAAEFVAWVQVLIYIGAVVILFLFGIMLTRTPMSGDTELNNDQRWPAVIVSLFLFGVLVTLLVDAFGSDDLDLTDGLVTTGRSSTVANSIFQTLVIPFEVVSILLLGALVGAVVLARRD